MFLFRNAFHHLNGLLHDLQQWCADDLSFDRIHPEPVVMDMQHIVESSSDVAAVSRREFPIS